MSVLILSDIHGNLAALDAVICEAGKIPDITGCILLGDLIDYGPHSNEVISLIEHLPYPILCNIWGNHEQAVCTGEYDRFSSERGKMSARNTKKNLTEKSLRYIQDKMNREGFSEFVAEGYRCLAVHGSLDDCFWKSVELTGGLQLYKEYDYVFSGHSHIPHFLEKYFPAADERYRNRKKTVFLNPGSVGQPRNHNSRAQFAVLDFKKGTVLFQKTEYDIKKEQSAFSGQVDIFYRDRLECGV